MENINLKTMLKYVILFILLCIFIFYSNSLDVKALSNLNINNDTYAYIYGVQFNKGKDYSSAMTYRYFTTSQFEKEYYVNGTNETITDFLNYKFYFNPKGKKITPGFLRLNISVQTNQNEYLLKNLKNQVYVHTLFYALFDYDIENDKYANFEEYLSQKMHSSNNIREVKKTWVTIEGKSYVLLIFSHTLYPEDVPLFQGRIPEIGEYSGYGYYYFFDFTEIPEFGERLIPETSKSFISIYDVKLTYEDYYYSTNDFDLESLDMEQSNQNDFVLNNVDNSKRDNFFITFLKTIKEDFENALEKFWENTKIALKSMFVPSEFYMNVFITRAKDQIESQFGVFVYPIKLFIDILNRFLNLSSTNFVINVPDINVPLFDYPIIKATSYDLSEVLNKGSIHNLWILYLDFVDVYMIFAFLNLTWNKFNSFMGGTISENEYLTVEDSETYDNVTGEFKGSRRRVSKSKRQRRKII